MTEDRPGQAHHSDQDRPQGGLDRLTVAEAAERLGVTQDAVRKRMARGTIRHVREDGRLYVYLDTFERASNTIQDEGQDDASNTVSDEVQDRYARSLEDQIEYLRAQLDAERDANRENRRLLAAALERIPAIEAPRDEPGSPERSPEASEGASSRSDTVEAQEGVQEPGAVEEDQADHVGPPTATQPLERRSWWRRVFGR